jgi:hypothetical protein
MKKIIGNMQGIFTGYSAGYIQDVLADICYIGMEHDQKNIKQDISRLFPDMNSTIRKAKKKI